MTSDFKISSLEIDGIRNAKVILTGECKNKNDLKILIDGQQVTPKDNIILDKKYVVNRIKNIKTSNFNYYILLSKTNKKLEIYYKDKLIIQKKVSLSFRIIFHLKTIIKRLFSILKRLPKIIVKTLKLMWQRHHFLVPPRMLKQYLHSFNNNISNKNIDELFKELQISRKHMAILIDEYGGFSEDGN